jgi:hypothetical protein
MPHKRIVGAIFAGQRGVRRRAGLMKLCPRRSRLLSARRTACSIFQAPSGRIDERYFLDKQGCYSRSISSTVRISVIRHNLFSFAIRPKRAVLLGISRYTVRKSVILGTVNRMRPLSRRRTSRTGLGRTPAQEILAAQLRQGGHEFGLLHDPGAILGDHFVARTVTRDYKRIVPFALPPPNAGRCSMSCVDVGRRGWMYLGKLSPTLLGLGVFPRPAGKMSVEKT